MALPIVPILLAIPTAAAIIHDLFGENKEDAQTRQMGALLEIVNGQMAEMQERLAERDATTTPTTTTFRQQVEKLLDHPLPGDRVKIVGNPHRKHLLGKTGTVAEVWSDANVLIDGEKHH